ncbi:hypothetical protein D7B24_004846 [Verticillium nonalfalfae]|uniref:Uncharacterized protein n=1 Tax=Verticillium nonalfalfae TaxID=1051616 RepID=A0A3M9YDC2_9PEZI|nr:uncharacterized protein D7B24_004846 [Verticillium nonalfalfae]RNJ58394.1 hypothetical protein D7B24_004846 [Verticillium nonalfalfae]
MPSSHYLNVERLDSQHRHAVSQALSNVLATDAALVTFAQIIDGLPICDIAWDTRGTKLTPQHPINSHNELCPEARAKAEEFRGDFKSEALVFKPELLQSFQSSSTSSRGFALRLLELTASAIHQIAVLLFQRNLRLHDRTTTDTLDVDEVTSWERPPDMWARVVPHPTLFTQSHFVAHEQYPDGIADMVGYWAEDRILGGVILFDHSSSWHDQNIEPNAYIHCGRDRITYRICQLLDDQQSRLIEFLRSREKHPEERKERTNGPLPILPSSDNRTRIDQGDAIPVHKVYRDIWERAPPQKPRLRMQQYMDRRVLNELDYPELNFDEQMERFNNLSKQPQDE